MKVEDYRKLVGVKPSASAQMSAGQWREMMKSKTKSPKKAAQSKNSNEIKLMLQLTKLEFVEEHKFHPTRKWRFDFAIIEGKIAIEYEGIFGGKSRHTTISGYSGDAEKYNEAAKLGWKVLRYTAKTYKNVVEDIRQILTETRAH